MIGQRGKDEQLFCSSGVASASSPAVGKGMRDALSKVSVLFGAGMGGAITVSAGIGSAAEASSASLSSSLAVNLGFGGMTGFLPKMGGPIPTCTLVISINQCKGIDRTLAPPSLAILAAIAARLSRSRSSSVFGSLSPSTFSPLSASSE